VLQHRKEEAMIRFEIAILAITIVVLPQVGLAGGCGDGQCSVGAAGNGGDASKGSAQGYLQRFPGASNPDNTLTATGNDSAGRFNVKDAGGTTIGSFQGTLRDGLNRGHISGIFGDQSGTCDPFDPTSADFCPID
jgi:hypothetical protein